MIGTERVRFLNGQTTNDVRKASSDVTQESCVLNAKGHLDAHIFLFAVPNEIWIDADAELSDQLQGRLERYIIADDVLVEDASKAFALFHVLAELKPEGVEAKFCLRSRRLGCDGWDLWVESVAAQATKEALAAKYHPADENEWDRSRIENGIPRWGRELTPDIIPPEANLAERAIDYQKGCYIGQEVISRMKMSGQLRQRLSALVSEEQLYSGMELRMEEKLVGRVTSSVFSARANSSLGLAMIKRGYNDIGTSLLASNEKAQTSVRVVALPMKGESAAGIRDAEGRGEAA
ncbi:MAG TPA: glycine cleavage T C-terminal barrel domain-containing protein [Chthoniobacterales bacterium]|nr:glycine cleavage T C-terminal barrel domain-containing protein [Chthoniobacterales bacterium]